MSENQDKEQKIDPQMAKSILLKLLPLMIENLAASERLDTTRLQDGSYLWDTLLENANDIFNESMVAITISDMFLEAAHEAIFAKRIPVAIVLIASAVEQELNIFYNEVMEGLTDLSDKQVRDVLRLSIHSKLDWLMLLSTEHDLSDGLKRKIKSLIDIRNTFIHYKPRSTALVDDTTHYDKLLEQVEQIGIENLVNIPTLLSEELNDIRNSIWAYREDAIKAVNVMLRLEEEE